LKTPEEQALAEKRFWTSKESTIGFKEKLPLGKKKKN
jgi:hypothetical protein